MTPWTGPVRTSRIKKALILSTSRDTAASLRYFGVAPGASSDECKYIEKSLTVVGVKAGIRIAHSLADSDFRRGDGLAEFHK